MYELRSVRKCDVRVKQKKRVILLAKILLFVLKKERFSQIDLDFSNETNHM